MYSSSRSKYDTPLPTPVHKHNKWAGRKTGQTPSNQGTEEDELDQKVT